MKKNAFKKMFQNIFLGADYDSEEEVYDEYADSGYEEETEEPRGKEITHLDAVRSRKLESETSKILNFRSGAQLQVMLTYPKEVADATTVCDYIREGSPCVVNLDGVERPSAQRIADFLGGAIYAFNGEIQRISNSIFIVSPTNIHINGEFEEELKSSGVIFPWIASSFR
ncbi:MAG: cell division protein SepF [Clostridiales bacterium]|nr:cell division protein SepF [Clostridiales bacterium]